MMDLFLGEKMDCLTGALHEILCCLSFNSCSPNHIKEKQLWASSFDHQLRNFGWVISELEQFNDKFLLQTNHNYPHHFLWFRTWLTFLNSPEKRFHLFNTNFILFSHHHKMFLLSSHWSISQESSLFWRYSRPLTLKSRPLLTFF